MAQPEKSANLRTDIDKPLFICGCGWTSWDTRYDLAYHAEKHNCKKAKRMKEG